jgi:uncharacterized protein YqjF (DUF2071 family)
MHQNWEDLLFLHWAFDPELLRAVVPAPLELDLFDDKAWIGITAFRVTGLKLTGAPEIPGFNAFDELNVRTYVHYKGIPGIYFLSLDASKLIPALAARLFYALPYYKAQVDYTKVGNEFFFDLKRTTGPSVAFNAHWTKGIRLQDPALESLAFFLVERYCFFTAQSNSVQLSRVYHHPWILDEARVLSCTSTMLNECGLPNPQGEPLAHFSSLVDVDIWAPQAV